MRITLLGTGGPRPDPTRQGPATLVQAADLNLLFDAGRGVATQLVRAGIQVTDLDAVFITHHHFDHIGGLGDLIMAVWNNGRKERIPVIGPPGTVEIINGLLDRVFARDINFRITEERALGRRLDHPSSMLEVREVDKQRITVTPGVEVLAGQVEHGADTLGLRGDEWCSLGYRVNADGRSLAISGDAVDGLDLPELAASVDVLVMCAYLGEDEISTPADKFLVHRVIAGAPQAAAIASRADVRHLILTHIREKSDDEIEVMENKVRAVFPGTVTVGCDLMTVDV